MTPVLRPLCRPMASGYLTDMLVVRSDGFVDPCIPSLAHKRRSRPTRLTVRRDGSALRQARPGTGISLRQRSAFISRHRERAQGH
jgi:hypothetical protein